MVSSIVVVGASNWDMFTYCDEMPKPGETIKGNDFKTSFGGKAANQAVQASKLGSNVSIITKLGNDVYGKNTLENFKLNNIDISNVGVVNDIPSGCASIVVDKKGENFIVIVGGSNDLLVEKDIEESKSTILQSKYVLCQLEVSFKTTLSALKLAKSNESCTTILNATPITNDPIFKNEILNFVDILIVNEIELKTLIQFDKHVDKSNIQEIFKLSEDLLNKFTNIKHLIVTVGSNGQVLVSKSLGNHHIEISNKVEKVVDTSGAGDSFIGAFVHYLEKSSNLIESIKKASIIAGISVQKYGTQTSYPNKSDLVHLKDL